MLSRYFGKSLLGHFPFSGATVLTKCHTPWGDLGYLRVEFKIFFLSSFLSVISKLPIMSRHCSIIRKLFWKSLSWELKRFTVVSILPLWCWKIPWSKLSQSCESWVALGPIFISPKACGESIIGNGWEGRPPLGASAWTLCLATSPEAPPKLKAGLCKCQTFTFKLNGSSGASQVTQTACWFHRGLSHFQPGYNPLPTCYGKVEILEVLDLPGALTGCETLVKGLKEVRKGQLHVRDGCPPVLTVVRTHRADEQGLEGRWEPVRFPDMKGDRSAPQKGIEPPHSSTFISSEETMLTFKYEAKQWLT